MHNTEMSLRPETEEKSVSRPASVADAMGRPLHDLRISLLDQCNFRCPYCMPEAEFHADYEFLKRQQRLTYDEILRVAAGASSLGVSPDPFLMAIAVAASCAFLTPIGHQNNALIMGPGGYRFGDYWRLGVPLEILVISVSIPMILWVWPLAPS